MPVANHQPPCQRRLCALLCLAALAALPPVLHAAEPAATPATQAGARNIDIGPGPLSEVLARYAASAGVALSFDAASLRQIPSPGLKGHYTVQQGFDRLLAGSGMEAVQTGAGNFALRRLPPVIQGETTLKPMLVTASAERDGTTEGTGSYTTRASSTATKLNLSPRETPQTVTVVTRQKMDDFGLTDVKAVLESTSTVLTENAGGNGVTYYSRGFRVQEQYDGIPNPIGIGGDNRGATPDTAFLDKVEVLNGAAGLMSGAGYPGGTVNLARKRPTESFQSHVEASLGSWNKKRLVGDISGALVDSGRIRGRVVALMDHGDDFTDYGFDDREGFYGVVEADATKSTTLGASVMYQKNVQNKVLTGVFMGPDGADLGLPRSSFYGIKDGRRTRESTSYTLNLEQKLPLGWLLKAAYTHADATPEGNVVIFSGTLNPLTGNGLSFVSRYQQREFQSDVFDAYLSGPLQLFGRKHELVFGTSTVDMKDKTRLSTPDSIIPFNIYGFDGATVANPAGTFPAWPAENETKQRGIYGAARLNLADTLKLILGTRVSWWKYQAAGRQTQEENAVVTPYAGVVWDFDKNYSAYASYSDIFQAQARLKYSGGTIDPIVGKNYELGVKGEFLQGRLNAAAAVFRLEQSNLSQADYSIPANACNGGQCYTAAGLVVSKGLDLSLNGEVAAGWQVGAGYTHVDSKYGKNNGANTGQPYATNIPDHIFRLHTSYQLPDTAWTVGGNVRYQSKVYQEGAGFRIRQGGYAVAGLMAKYQINKQADLGLVVNNLFDRRYYDPVGYSVSYSNFYGTPRNFAVNLKYAF